MSRVHHLTHRGRRVLRVDYSHLRAFDDLRAVAEEATRTIRSEPHDSVLSLVDLTGVPYSLRMIRMLAEVAAGNADFVRARAIVGLPDLALPAVNAVAEFTGRPVEAFDDAQEALDWLASRAGT